MVKLNKIYTRTGDDGSSGLVDGTRVSKASARMIAIGDVDEANSALGLAIAELGEHEICASLIRVQNELFDLGADLATPVTDEADPDWALRMIPAQATRLEREIDAMRLELRRMIRRQTRGAYPARGPGDCPYVSRAHDVNQTKAGVQAAG